MAADLAALPPAGPSGESTGYGDLYDEHLAPLLRLAYLLCGHRQQAEDVVAEAFARVLPQWERGKVTQPAAYLRRTLVNLLHSRGRRSLVERRETERLAAVRVVPVAIDAEAADRDVMIRALRRLPVRQRAVLVLRYYEDRSELDTAEALGISPGTVKSQTARALDRLRTLLQEAKS